MMWSRRYKRGEVKKTNKDLSIRSSTTISSSVGVVVVKGREEIPAGLSGSFPQVVGIFSKRVSFRGIDLRLRVDLKELVTMHLMLH